MYASTPEDINTINAETEQEEFEENSEGDKRKIQMSLLLYGTSIKRKGDGYILTPEEVANFQPDKEDLALNGLSEEDLVY